MKNKLINKIKKQIKKGFTLVEVMVVAIVVAILAVGSIMMFGGQPDTARTATRSMGAAELNNAIRQAENAGLDVSVGGADVDTTSVTTAVTDLSGLSWTNAAGVTESIQIKLTPAEAAAQFTLAQNGTFWVFSRQ